MKRPIYLLIFALLLIPALLYGTAASDDERGWWFSERFQGTSNAAGIVLKSNSTVGYAFNRHAELYSGLPVYFTRESASNQQPSRNNICNRSIFLVFVCGLHTSLFRAISQFTNHNHSEEA